LISLTRSSSQPRPYRQRNWAGLPHYGGTLALALFLAASPLRASIFDHDDRLTVLADARGAYAPIGLVWADKLATGFLVDKCHVLTVQHVFRDGQSPVGREVIFGAVIRDEQHWIWSWGKVVAAGGLENHPSDYDAARASDWVLLRLRKCIGSTIGYVSLQPASPQGLPELQSAGYPFDRKSAQGITVDPACRIHGERRGLWLNDCAALGGNSGSPIFSQLRERGTTRLQVYAMQSAAFGFPAHDLRFQPAYANVATPVSGILPYISKFLKVAPLQVAADTPPADVSPNLGR
jgi:V8-like Glu-specific endopeptidase